MLPFKISDALRDEREMYPWTQHITRVNSYPYRSNERSLGPCRQVSYYTAAHYDDSIGNGEAKIVHSRNAELEETTIPPLKGQSAMNELLALESLNHC